MEKSSDDVSNIHNRFSLTLINPASHYFSLVGSLVIAAVITATVYFGYHLNSDEIWFRIPVVIGILALTQLIDTHFTRKKEYSLDTRLNPSRKQSKIFISFSFNMF